MSQIDQIHGSDVYNYRRDSFSDRVCNDLSEVILQFLPIKDKFRFECVSKKFQRTVYQRHYQLISTEDMRQRSDTDLEKSLYFIREKDINNFETILQKLPHIRSLKSDILLNDSVIALIIKYCNHLIEFKASLRQISDTSKQLFGDRFGSQLTSIQLDLSYKSIVNSMVNIQQIVFNNKFYPSIKESNHGVFIDLMPLINTKNLKKVKLSTRLSKFNEDFDFIKSVTHLSVNYDIPIDIRYVSQLSQLISLEVMVFCDQSLLKSLIYGLNHLALNCLKLKQFILCILFGSYETNDLKTNDFMSEIKKFRAIKRFAINFVLPIRYLESKFEEYFKNAMKTGFQNLTHLTIKFEKLEFSETFLDNIAIYLPKLRHLIINSKIRVTEQTVDYVSRLSTLETLVLNITDNSLSDPFIKSFKNKLIGNCRKFESFSIIRDKTSPFKPITEKI